MYVYNKMKINYKNTNTTPYRFRTHTCTPIHAYVYVHVCNYNTCVHRKAEPNKNTYVVTE